MNQPLSHHLLTMAYQNAWANHRLGIMLKEKCEGIVGMGLAAIMSVDLFSRLETYWERENH